MKHALSALLIALLAGAIGYYESSTSGSWLRRGFGEWEAAGALPGPPLKIAAIELPAADLGIHGLDAALVLRAVLRFEPRAVAFLVPVEAGDDASLLISKLADAGKIPTIFTGNERLDPWSRVTISGGLPPFPKSKALAPKGRPVGGTAETRPDQALIAGRQDNRAVPSNLSQVFLAVNRLSASGVTGEIPGSIRLGSISIPIDAHGCTVIDPLAAGLVDRIDFDQLMLKIERSEQGDIGVDLEALFRDRVVAVEAAGGSRATALAAVCNGLTESPAPLGLSVAIGLLAVTLPWWRFSRLNRALFALGVTCLWALAALAIDQEFQIALPMAVAIVLPLLAFLPPGWPATTSNKVQDRKLAA